MPFTPGTRLGSFEVAGLLGAGGMGEVYRATDTILKREVAVKVLPTAFVEDADRLARFRREAEILASLNHPNIAQVFGLEQADGVTAIVMELVEGPTLADRLQQGPLPPDEAMGIAFQVLAALEAAHAKHIVHRDLKPANIKVNADGPVKVLDFGISKPIDPKAISGASPVMTTPAVTATGVILGTAAYMSPEQARGKFVDERTDIWAFGCLLFEMLTGQPAFGGEDVMLTLARVLDRATDVSSIPKTISPAVRHTIELCLAKDPKRRIADVRDVRLALEGTFESGLPHPADSPAAVALWQRARLPGATLLLGFGLAAAAALAIRTEPAPSPLNRFVYTLPPEQLLVAAQAIRYFDLSPDGRRFIYTTTDGVYKREMDELGATLIRGTEGDGIGIGFVGFGPRSDEIYLARSSATIERLSIEGGATTLAVPADPSYDEAMPDAESKQWTPAGDLLVGHRGGISIQKAEAGAVPERVIDLDDNELASGARLLPDGDTVLFALRRAGDDVESSSIVTQSIATGRRTEILARGYYPRYVDSGHLLYVRDDVIHAIAFDLDSLQTTGRDAIVVPDVRLSASRIPQYGVADDGTMAYLQHVSSSVGSEDVPLVSLAWLYPDGRLEPLPIDGARYFQPAISPDGQSLVLSELPVDGVSDLYLYDLRRPKSRAKLTRGTFSARPLWTADGRQIVFDRGGPGGGLSQMAANGTGDARQLTSRPDPYVASVPYWISPDGKTLVFERAGPASGTGIFRLDSASGTVTPLIDDPDFRETGAALSPDMRYIAYSSDEAGPPEIFIRPYPDTSSDRVKVSTNGGTEPVWDHEGFLYYLDPGLVLMRIAVQTDPRLQITGDPEPVYPVPLIGGAQTRPNYGYDAVGHRFLVRQNNSLTAVPSQKDRIVIVQHWTEWLKRELPTD